jgi:hypothetical protein
MKIPVFAGETLAEFLKSAKLVRTDELSDGSEVNVYGVDVVAPSFCAQQNCGAEESLHCCGRLPALTGRVLHRLQAVVLLLE